MHVSVEKLRDASLIGWTRLQHVWTLKKVDMAYLKSL
jgi:hypothetical protein